MKTKYVVLTALVLLPATILPGQTSSDEEVVELNPFQVSSEEDSGYKAASTLAGTRIRTDLKDVVSGISVVTAEFLKDTGAAVPSVPITLVKKADALVIQFAIAATADKAEARNAELNSYIAAITKAVQAAPGLRFEPREVYLASADRKRSVIGKGGVVTSFAHFVVFAELSEQSRPYQRVKQVRDLLTGLKIDTQSAKLMDGPVGLYIRRPSQYRTELLAKIFEDLESVRKGVGPEFEVQLTGLSAGVRMRTCSETDVELWIDYSLTVRSIREIEAKKK